MKPDATVGKKHSVEAFSRHRSCCTTPPCKNVPHYPTKIRRTLATIGKAHRVLIAYRVLEKPTFRKILGIRKKIQGPICRPS